MDTTTVKLKTIESSENVTFYSICFDESNVSEFEHFMEKYRQNEIYGTMFSKIIYTLNEVILKNGALERYFRPEGGNVKALSFDSGKLRLYCLRISDQILILGNGGVKTTRTYQESEELNGYVVDLREFNQLLANLQRKGEVEIVGNNIDIKTDKPFII